MERGKKRIWLCLLVLVLAAVVIGAIYYYSGQDTKESTEGTLIREMEVQRHVV